MKCSGVKWSESEGEQWGVGAAARAAAGCAVAQRTVDPPFPLETGSLWEYEHWAVYCTVLCLSYMKGENAVLKCVRESAESRELSRRTEASRASRFPRGRIWTISWRGSRRVSRPILCATVNRVQRERRGEQKRGKLERREAMEGLDGFSARAPIVCRSLMPKRL